MLLFLSSANDSISCDEHPLRPQVATCRVVVPLLDEFGAEDVWNGSELCSVILRAS